MKKNKAYKGIKWIIILLLVLLIVAAAWYLYFNNIGNKAVAYTGDYKAKLKSSHYGAYRGVYEVWPGTEAAIVSFSADSGKLVQFNIDKLMQTPGYKIEQEIEEKVRTSGELEFDAISGATYSSYFIKAAIRKALE
ncbi:MAG: FMN-binding protein [Bacteroidales bacterium]|nr:FMN-binding protein [Bacteroidales bacterium]MCF8352291.1 FMN-binding protein [Bacteroidales bacterium]MCF8377189.1 FMN-binding protein [Bacteroidales bacterium]MCF8401060.1 FMN-binding protein [Bacteroidales bacterium]